MVERADIHNCISIEARMAGAVGAAMVDSEWSLSLVEVLDARTHFFDCLAMDVHVR
jgi:hypothetical protein